ncbi:acyltransferase family protein [Planctomycetes bacterium K23_9]|uniref:Glucans biosynthesis protein C n=1 Tax=Stieleria marina TaxID=1930275 RepID=A0A517NXE4_9BACT|nr:Glucans biosynthesis protein C [Planctomycetes bacterium K23_9]
MNSSTLDFDSRSQQQATADTDSAIQSTRPSAPFDRRHDLDALRAIAMLLGIVLHAALSFAPFPWPVQDSQQSEMYEVLFAFIHGFRMPLFFMLSGFFTAMLWRKRGLASLIKQRIRRILLPLVIGCVTIVPAMWVVSAYVSRPATVDSQESALFAAVVSGDIEAVRSELQNPEVDIDAWETNSGSSPLCTAVFIGQTEIAEMLVDAQANVNQANRDRASPLHIAVFMGRPRLAGLLIQSGADLNAYDGSGLTPKDLLTFDFGTTNYIASSLGVPLDQETLLAARKEIAELMGESDYLGSDAGTAPASGLQALEPLLFQVPVFMHLWFLAFLCWLVAAFVPYTLLAKALRINQLPRWIVCSPASLLWLIPLTMLPQSLMQTGGFGPDSSIGLFPIPHVLAYYAIFFFFGAVYWDMNDHRGQLGRWWFVSLPLAIVVVFPLALDLNSEAFGIVPQIESDSTRGLAGSFLQATFVWLMTFGSIGLCRRLLSGENKKMRYLSDSSYWLYLVHLPLVILAQWLVRDVPLPGIVKFVGVTIVISSLLLVTYAYGVRYTAIGRMLNGPRVRGA